MKRAVGWMLAAALALCMSGGALADAEITASARAAILMERRSGRVLFAQNADERYPMASTTKIMTALLAVERCGMDEIVTVGPRASGVTGSSIYLAEGERLTMRQMLLGLMLRSGNDAAVAIAEHIAGDEAAFAALMNERAQALGADALFVTANGLDEGEHGASARAMALIACEAMGNPLFRELVATKEAVIPWADSEYSRVLRNKNRLLSGYEGATGVKTGFTAKAGRCLVFSAERDGMELVGVVLKCPAWFEEAERLMDWGFGRFSWESAVEAGKTAGETNVLNGEKATVPLIAAKTLAYPLCAEDEWRLETVIEESLEAPVEAGAAAGYMALIVNGEEVARSELTAGEAVRRRTLWGALRQWLSSLPFFGRN